MLQAFGGMEAATRSATMTSLPPKPEKQKKCSKCGETRPLDEFYKDRTTKDGYKYRCKVCMKEYKEQRCVELAINNYEVDYDAKECIKCGNVMLLEDFFRSGQEKDGRTACCKECEKERKSEYNKTKRPALAKAWARAFARSDKGKEHIRNYRRKYIQTPKGKKFRLESSRRDRAKHPRQHKARAAVSRAVYGGKLPRAKDLPCSRPGCEEQATGYDHHQGYSKNNWLNVVAMCTPHHVEADKLVGESELVE